MVPPYFSTGPSQTAFPPIPLEWAGCRPNAAWPSPLHIFGLLWKPILRSLAAQCQGQLCPLVFHLKFGSLFPLAWRQIVGAPPKSWSLQLSTKKNKLGEKCQVLHCPRVAKVKAVLTVFWLRNQHIIKSKMFLPTGILCLKIYSFL